MILKKVTNILFLKIWCSLKSQITGKGLSQRTVESLLIHPTFPVEILQLKRQVLSNLSCLFWHLLVSIFIDNMCKLLSFTLSSLGIIYWLPVMINEGLGLLYNLPLSFCSPILPVQSYYNLGIYYLIFTLLYPINFL